MAIHQVFKAGNVALITGAASGIGLEVAKLCSGYGMKLVLVDEDSTGLYQTRQAIGETAGVRCLTVDVSNVDSWQYVRFKAEEFWGVIDFLFLHQSLYLCGIWQNNTVWHKRIAANALAFMEGVSWFLPGLRRKTTSTAILITGLGKRVFKSRPNAAYAASKAAIEAFTEALHEELQSTFTSVHLLVPEQACFESSEVMSKFLQQKMLAAELRISLPIYVIKTNEKFKRKSRTEDTSEDHLEDEAPISKRLKTEPRD
ncbi:MAG: hypothetical protein Q9174_002279 [Haloplaca sp. 1 TL-2023]